MKELKSALDSMYTANIHRMWAKFSGDTEWTKVGDFHYLTEKEKGHMQVWMGPEVDGSLFHRPGLEQLKFQYGRDQVEFQDVFGKVSNVMCFTLVGGSLQGMQSCEFDFGTFLPMKLKCI